MTGGMYSPEEIAAHEQSIFYEETKQKVLDDLSDGMVNLCPTKISQGKTLESVYNFLEDLFLHGIVETPCQSNYFSDNYLFY